MIYSKMNSESCKKIGLIGGMGSAATIATYRKIIEISQKDSKLSPHLIINNLPQENIFDQLEDSLATMICHGIEDLANAGVSVVGISCNTAHAYTKSIRFEVKRRNVEFVSIIDSVINHCVRSGFQRIGILATPKGCDIYREAIRAGSMVDFVPSFEQQQEINQVIRSVLQGLSGQSQRECLDRVKDCMYEQGCETVILGCTELPLVFGDLVPTGYICSITVLAESLLQVSRRLN